jgi:hypothetical protein
MVFNRKEYMKKYRQKNKEKIKEYYQKNKDRIKQKTKEWRQRNKQKILQYLYNNRKNYIKKLGGVCFFCNSAYNLDFHHWDCGKYKHTQEIYLPNLDLTNLLLLCHSCHQKLHEKLRTWKNEM